MSLPKIKINLLLFIVAIILFGFIFSCKEKNPSNTSNTPKETHKVTPPIVKRKPVVIRSIPHQSDKTYTQGFEIYDGYLYESTGLDKLSSLKKIDLKTGEILKMVDVENVFAEGLTIFNGQINILTYRTGLMLTFDLDSFYEKNKSYIYNTEGWGLTNNGSQFIMSDGSDKLYFRDASSFKLMKTISVTQSGLPVGYINELEYVDGKIYANVYGSPFIKVIDPTTGIVIEDIDATSILCSQMSNSDPEAVLNGIAYNPESKTFYITGKRCQIINEVIFE